jgi:hypothetical protein
MLDQSSHKVIRTINRKRIHIWEYS